MEIGKYIRTPDIREKNRVASNLQSKEISVRRKKYWASMTKDERRKQLKNSIKNLNCGVPWNKGKKQPQTSKERHPNWKGGISTVNHILRTSVEYKKWRTEVFTRDDYICQKYKTKGNKLVVHHILSFVRFPELRFVPENGITLSLQAHREFHRKYGYINYSHIELGEFLGTREDYSATIFG